jgi:glyceraldehyde-3-phosphate dehydrogenase (NAD(P))
MTTRVGVNGYGTIGKRVADAVARQPDMKLAGVADIRPNYEIRTARAKGYPVFVTGNGTVDQFEGEGLNVAGRIEDLIRASDIIVDCSPESTGRVNAKIYQDVGIPSVFQGGEKADVASLSFSALANYDAARGKKHVRVVSCNTTAICRAAAVLLPAFGVDHWEATLVRRAADPQEVGKGPIDGILPSFKVPSHQGPDVQTVFPGLSITTTALTVSTTMMHVHSNHVRLSRPPASTQGVIERFRATPRFHLFKEGDRVTGTPQVMEYGRDRALNGRPDVMENVLWEHGIHLVRDNLYFFQAIHQESIVIPETIDAIRAMLDLAPDAATSIEVTDRALGIPRPTSAGRLPDARVPAS